ncbi:hypothetical protein IQ07DRAFT_431006 [Pyrenochaeta sp. DS3sAY3a]|nr:hypothetical protein IQ07DRAFT_431006 [Pyrenochaeta sp. DS3sAY3a]
MQSSSRPWKRPHLGGTTAVYLLSALMVLRCKVLHPKTQLRLAKDAGLIGTMRVLLAEGHHLHGDVHTYFGDCTKQPRICTPRRGTSDRKGPSHRYHVHPLDNLSRWNSSHTDVAIF